MKTPEESTFKISTMRALTSKESRERQREANKENANEVVREIQKKVVAKGGYRKPIEF